MSCFPIKVTNTIKKNQYFQSVFFIWNQSRLGSRLQFAMLWYKVVSDNEHQKCLALNFWVVQSFESFILAVLQSFHFTTVEFSKYREAFLNVPVNFIFLSHWFLTWDSCEGNFSRTPMQLVSKLKAWLLRWWSSFNSFWRVCNSVKSSLQCKLFSN